MNSHIPLLPFTVVCESSLCSVQNLRAHFLPAGLAFGGLLSFSAALQNLQSLIFSSARKLFAFKNPPRKFDFGRWSLWPLTRCPNGKSLLHQFGRSCNPRPTNYSLLPKPPLLHYMHSFKLERIALEFRSVFNIA